MMQSSETLKTRYRFADFLCYTCLLAVPILTAILAVFRHSVLGTIVFGVLAVVVTALLLKFYCTRCPHYTREGKRLKCLFFWGLPKFFAPRSGPLTGVDKLVAFAATAVLLVFPLFWLRMEWGLLVVYVLSLVGFGAAVYRNECARCIYSECPLNRVPEGLGAHPQNERKSNERSAGP